MPYLPEPSIVIKNSFTLVGIEARTNNQSEFEGVGKIGPAWERFYQEAILSKIPAKKNALVISAYTNYQTDMNGDYTFVLGASVDPAVESFPEELIRVDIPAAKYARFTSRVGKCPDVVIELWQHIWQLTNENKINRAYATDFEVYDERAHDPDNAVVDIFISIK